MSGIVIVILSGHYGFPLTYDLLLATISFKAHPNASPTIEKTAIKKVTSDWLQPQIWLIILVLLADHNPNIPKFQIESGITKFKEIFQETDAVSKLIEHLHGLLTATPSSRPHQIILSIVCGLFHEFRITLRI